MTTLPLQITFRHVDLSPALEARICALAAKLDKFSPQIIRCRISVEAPHRHHHQGALFHIHIHLTVPDREIVISRANSTNRAHEDPYVALRDAFRAARRKLADYERRRRLDVKTHNTAGTKVRVDEDAVGLGRQASAVHMIS